VRWRLRTCLVGCRLILLCCCRTFSPALDLSAFPDNMSPSGDVERDDVLRQRIRIFSWIEPKHLDLPIPPRSDTSAASTPELSSSPRLGSEEEAPSAETASTNRSEEAEPPRSRPSTGNAKTSRKQVQSFLNFAQSELCKMNQYKAPRDKLICVLNCCKVIFGGFARLLSRASCRSLTPDTFAQASCVMSRAVKRARIRLSRS
jgi:hypothetical protein